jgi:hypothetical protein
MGRAKQADRILALLQVSKGQWVSLPQIMDLHIACHTKRISELRRDGHIIELRDEYVHSFRGCVRHTSYRWLGRLSDEAKAS